MTPTQLPLTEFSDAVIAGDEKIDVIIDFSLEELLDFNIESLNDYVEERILSEGILEDIAYEAVGFQEGRFLVRVRAFLY